MKDPRIRLLVLLVVGFSSCSKAARFMPAAPRPIAAVNRVLIISVDGLRPDLALRADTPCLHRLLKGGCFTFWARTTEMSITLPSHTSMLTGVTPKRHHVTWNSDQLPPQQYPAVPTLFEIARRAGLTTAMVAGKTKFAALAKPGTLDWSSVRQSSDAAVARQAITFIRDHQPQVMFVHLPDVDLTGHMFGWASDAQIAAIGRADRCIAEILDALSGQGLVVSTLVIITADHGGAGATHGPDDPRSRHIPWIAVNPAIRQGYDLTRNSRLVVNTEDTFATACFVLGLPMEAGMDGKPIAEIVPNRELLHPDR